MGVAFPQTKLAGVYQHGHGGLQDPAKALARFHKAASQGDAEAEYNLAKMYKDHDSVLFDYRKAHSWYRLAAINGHRSAKSRLGLLFEFGKSVAQSRVQAHICEMRGRHPDVEIVLIESGGDNLSATFSPELADVTVYVIDVAAGEEIPRKGGPAIMKSDVLVINKTDLAPMLAPPLR